MFLDKTIERNSKLIDAGIKLYKQGKIIPDSYIVDVDSFLNNAKIILEKARENNIHLYFMLKQIGRNPYLARKLIELGYEGAVAVDYREAMVLMKNNIHLGNVGHLVQTPKNLIKRIMQYGTDVFTVYSYDKLKEINECAEELGVLQNIIIKVSGEDDIFYSGQFSGIELKDLSEFIHKSQKLKNVRLIGVTAFPCYLYSYEDDEIKKTNNYYTVEKACKIIEKEGINLSHINTPSTISVLTIEQMKDDIGNYGEPGHGLSGTTPAHAFKDLAEVPSVIYMTEISHNFRGKSYCYGGGYYRRSHLEKALIIDESSHFSKVSKMADDSIDYYFELEKEEIISSIVIMAFRFQMFVTRSLIVLVSGIGKNEIEIVGVYNSLGGRVE